LANFAPRKPKIGYRKEKKKEKRKKKRRRETSQGL
jgi:hypothetical protein